MTRDQRTAAQQEIRDLIAFYERRGWDWTDAVAFTALRALGLGPFWWLR